MSRPWMPLYVADYRNDTAHLSAAEHGAYLLLIMHYWTTGSLPDDDRQLARISSMTAAEWRRTRPIVQPFFHDGWKHKRIDAELARAAEISSKRRASAEQRHSKCNANAPANAPANAEQLDTHARASSQPQSQSQKATPSRRRASALPADFKLADEDIQFALDRGFTGQQAAEEFSRFCDHAAANDRRQVDWRASWRNWITSPLQRNGHANGKSTRHGSASEQAQRLADLVRAREREGGAAGADDLFPGDRARRGDVEILPPERGH